MGTTADHDQGIAPIPGQQATMSGWDSWVLWASLGVSFLVMVVGMFLVPALGLGEALLAILVGAAIGNALLGIAAAIGCEVRVPTMVLMRAPLGIRGSYLPTGLNVLQLIGWAVFEVIVMAQAADVLATGWLGLPPAYPVWVVAFTALTFVMAMLGPVVVTKQWLRRIGVWAALIALVWLTVVVFLTYDVPSLFSRPGTGSMTFWRGVDLVVALPISWFPLVADYSRFARTRAGALWGTGGGYFVSQVWLYALGALLALAGSVVFDPVAPVVPLLSAIAVLSGGWLALLVLLVVETDEAFANVYSTALSIQNWFPRLERRTLVVGICAVVLVVGLAVPLTRYEAFLLLIGALFVPLLGVLAADYFALRGQRYPAAELYRPDGMYAYAGGFNTVALFAWLVGVAVYLGAAGLPTDSGAILGGWLGTGPIQLGGWLPVVGGTLPSFVVAFLLHALVGRIAIRRPAVAAARP